MTTTTITTTEGTRRGWAGCIGTRTLHEVGCPCCKGAGRLVLHDAAYPDEAPQRVICCHCDGEGYVLSEVEVDAHGVAS